MYCLFSKTTGDTVRSTFKVGVVIGLTFCMHLLITDRWVLEIYNWSLFVVVFLQPYASICLRAELLLLDLSTLADSLYGACDDF